LPCAGVRRGGRHAVEEHSSAGPVMRVLYVSGLATVLVYSKIIIDAMRDNFPQHLDTSVPWDAAAAHALYTRRGVAGREADLAFYAFDDLLLPPCYACFLGAALSARGWSAVVAVLLPLLAAVFDFTENLSIVTLIRSYPETHEVAGTVRHHRLRAPFDAASTLKADCSLLRRSVPWRPWSSGCCSPAR
jgi:hypothetical protein